MDQSIEDFFKSLKNEQDDYGKDRTYLMKATEECKKNIDDLQKEFQEFKTTVSIEGATIKLKLTFMVVGLTSISSLIAPLIAPKIIETLF